MNVKVKIEVSYDSIRKMICLSNGEVWSDEKILDFVGSNELEIKSNDSVLQEKDVAEGFAALVIAHKMELKKALEPKVKSKFQERLEEMQKQQMSNRKKT